MVLVFSTTKGVTAVCANKLAQEGALDVDAPVAKYPFRAGPSATSARAARQAGPIPMRGWRSAT
jgi:CubicO group peptidase (beta-lactamase class C family)